ncbi:MAG: type III pantothenate kinase [Saprospiraceae bacterium]
MNNFVIDIGNTRTKAALFSKGELVLKETWDKPAVDAFEKMTYNQTLQNIILSSTANVPVVFEQHLEEKFRYIRLDTETPLPITIIYQTPHTLGKDRIAAAVAADCLFPDENILVIDAALALHWIW